MVPSTRQCFNGTDSHWRWFLWIASVFCVASTSFAQSNNGSTPEAVQNPAGVIQRIGPAGLKTYRWDFSRVGDSNFDQWPDDWTRHRGPSYPDYVLMRIIAVDKELEAAIQPIDSAIAAHWPSWQPWFPSMPMLLPSVADFLVNRCLSIDIDGGLVKVQSPPLPTSPLYQYQFGIDVRTEGLVHDLVLAEVVFADPSGKEIGSRQTESVTKTRGWQKLRIEQLVPPPGSRAMMVRLLVRGSKDGLEDIRGNIQFDNVEFRQFPQMEVATDRPLGIYRTDEPVKVRTELLGVPEQEVSVRLSLINQMDEVVDSRIEVIHPSTTIDQDRGLTFEWPLGPTPAGFYRVTAKMLSDTGASLAAETSYVSIDTLVNRSEVAQTVSSSIPEATPPPFGWTLSADMVRRHREGELHEREIALWLRSMGVGWAKLPVWFEPNDVSAADAAVTLAMRLTDQRVNVIGLLDQPPESRIDAYKVRDRASNKGTAALLRDSSVWRPELDRIMDIMTSRIRTWQLGSDSDYSFTDQVRLDEMIQRIGEDLQGFGQPIELAIAWSWLDPEPTQTVSSWKAVQRHVRTPLTADELEAWLDFNLHSNQKKSPRQTWISIDPLPAGQYDREARIADLVLRMATTRGHDVKAAFVTQPFAADRELLRADGRPGELLLPWRTTSQLISDATNIGSIPMRHGTRNIVFRGARQSVMMVWSDRPSVEELYLGENVEEIDVWGRRRPIPVQQSSDPREADSGMVHRIVATPLPRFIVGIDAALAEFRMSVELDRERVDSVLGTSQTVGVRFSNPINQPLDGHVSLTTPNSWTRSPIRQDWQLLPDQTETIPFEVVLSNNATVGRYELPIDFEFSSTPPLKIRDYRVLSVGPEGFDLQVTTQLNGDQIRVKMELTNQTERPASFDCLLFAGPGRQYERRIMTVGPGETTTRVIDWGTGKDLIGTRMLLRAIEQNGKRVINHTFIVEP